MNKDVELGVRWYSIFDWPLFLLVLSVSFFSVLMIYSANFTSESEFTRSLYLRQLEWNFYGLLLLVLIAAVDYRILEKPTYLLYIVFIILLVKVLFSARVISGSQRWLPIGGMNFQPSELMKIVLIVTLARYFNDRRDRDEMGFKQLLVPAVVTLVPFMLIAKQPDMGTAMILLAIFVVMAFINGIRKGTLKGILLGSIVLVPVAWLNLKAYQKSRILTMLDPSADPLGTGYHTIQSKIAIGSGGLMGKGFFAGTQSKLNFLPEKHTDFIFAVFAEETGFIGTAILLALYLFILLRMIDVITKAQDREGALIATGVTAMFGAHIFYNVAMTLGLTPIMGIPLPLLSYGGSSTLANYAAMGLLLSVHVRRFRHD
jgi:rod shape determining protein RodA